MYFSIGVVGMKTEPSEYTWSNDMPDFRYTDRQKQSTNHIKHSLKTFFMRQKDFHKRNNTASSTDLFHTLFQNGF